MMNNILFGISNPFEYAKKLDREYKRLSSSSGKKSKQDQIDHALNFAVAAWHLADRVFKYPNAHSALEEKGFKDWKAFSAHVFSMCPELSICYDLSISYKHYNDNRNTAKTVKSAVQVSEGGIAKINGVPISTIAKINGVPISQIAKINGVSISGNIKLIITRTDGTELNFIDIAGAVNAFWQKELESLKT
jgi:hypothetical protein